MELVIVFFVCIILLIYYINQNARAEGQSSGFQLKITILTIIIPCILPNTFNKLKEIGYECGNRNVGIVEYNIFDEIDYSKLQSAEFIYSADSTGTFIESSDDEKKLYITFAYPKHVYNMVQAIEGGYRMTASDLISEYVVYAVPNKYNSIETATESLYSKIYESIDEQYRIEWGEQEMSDYTVDFSDGIIHIGTRVSDLVLAHYNIKVTKGEIRYLKLTLPYLYLEDEDSIYLTRFEEFWEYYQEIEKTFEGKRTGYYP